MLHKIAKGVATLCLAVSLTCIPVLASEGTLDTTYIPIEGQDFVATNMDGVPSIYGGNYNCAELLPRYYEAVYGLDILIGNGSISVLNNSDIYFTETTTPKKGDILYASAEAREKSYCHWALVKKMGEGTMTLFEQNWSWNGQAGIDRVLSFPDNCYTAYTMASRSGSPLPERLVPETGLDSASSWSVDYVEEAEKYVDLDVVLTDAIQRDLFCQVAVAVAEEHGMFALGTNAKEQAANLGLISNTESETISRQEAAVITARLMSLIGELPEADFEVLNQYVDCDLIPDWSAEAVAQMTASGLLCGSNGMFHPTDTLTVEQAVVLLMRVADNATPIASDLTYNAAPVSTASMEVVRLCGKSAFLSR